MPCPDGYRIVGDEKEAHMKRTVLVTCASKHGSTQEVADAVAQRLRGHDLDVSLLPVGEVETLEGFDAVVLGAALYLGRLHGDARRFLRRWRRELAKLPTAVFAMGPLTLEDAAVTGARKQLAAGLAHVPELHPVETAVFGGVVDPAELHFPFTRMPASDARDWQAIDAWSDQVAAALGSAREAVAATA
jgi:menaquinone-dependent protoporphyrinogen oxidase